MTRIVVYAALLVVSIAATVMTISSIYLPNWISYSVPTPSDTPLTQHIGLHRSCSNFRDPPCRPYPTEDQCAAGGAGASFCRMWRSAGFLADLAVVLHLSALVAYAVLVAGGRRRRESGWAVVAGLLLVVSVVEYAIVGIISYLFDNNDQFTIPGWSLDTSWHLCVASASLSAACAIGLATSRYLLPPEGGYDFLPDPEDEEVS